MGEVNVNIAIEKIRSGKIRDRNDGLAGSACGYQAGDRAKLLIDLKHILEQNRRSPKLDLLTDKGYHKIFEALFCIVSSEKSKYVKATASVSRTRIHSQLSSCANIIRLATEVGLRKIRAKTVKALVDHVTQTLPNANQDFFEPLLLDYIKILRTLFQYQAHPEHLLKEEWRSAVDFCTEAITKLTDLEVNSSSDGPNRRSSRTSTPSILVNSSSNSNGASIRSSYQAINFPFKIHAEELALCLQYLASVSNCPIHDKAQSILGVLLASLQSAFTTTRTQQAAFSTVNQILTRVRTDDVHLTLQTIKDLIPLVRRLWQTKSAALKEEILILLTLGEALLPSLLSPLDFEGADDCRDDLEGLLEAFRTDYCRRSEKEQLQLDDLDFCVQRISSRGQIPWSMKGFRLRLGLRKSESQWAILHTIASLISMLNKNRTQASSNVPSYEDNASNKRRRIMQPLDDCIHLSKSPVVAERLCALQCLAFAVNSVDLNENELQTVLDSIVPLLSEDNGSIASWAMLVMTSSSHQMAAHSAIFKDLWTQTWRIAARTVTSALVCRAACLVMLVILDNGLIAYTDISETADSILSSSELNGPAVFSDSSAALLSLLIDLKSRESPGVIQKTADQVLRWLFLRWSPSKFNDRHYTSHTAYHCQVNDLLGLISICLGLPCHEESYNHCLNLSALSQARVHCLQDQNLMQYLTLTQSKSSATFNSSFTTSPISRTMVLSDAQYQTLTAITNDHLIAELNSILHVDTILDLEKGLAITPESIRSLSSLCIVCCAMSSNQNVRDTRKILRLMALVDKLRSMLIDYFEHHDERGELLNAFLETVVVCQTHSEDALHGKSMAYQGMLIMAQGFEHSFWKKAHYDVAKIDNGHDEGMDLDDGFESQRSHTRNDDATGGVAHNHIAAATDALALRSSVTAWMCYVTSFPIDSTQESMITSPFVEYLMSLPPSELLASRSFLKDLLQSNPAINEKDGFMVMQHLGQLLLQSYEFERCEVSLGVCLDFMTGLARYWSSPDGGDFRDAGESLYEWFIKVALGKGILSPHVHISLSSMLQCVIKVRPNFAKSLSLPSARTSLFRVLAEGNIAVKYHIARHISEIFGLFILREHDAILEDVIDSLPSERDWPEGIALRLLTLAYLAASWSTLLRRCVYAIFETPGHIIESTGYARHCMVHVSTSLGLSQPRDLFKIFVSQILYTWLETQTLRLIPYAVFGYEDLAALLEDVCHEVTGQVIMRCQDDEATQLAANLGKPLDELLERSFGKAAAYSIARDIAFPPSEDSKASGAVLRIRNCLGREKYATLISNRFPEILALFYKAMDQEEHIEKGFQKLQKQHQYANAHRAYKEITSASSSSAILPMNQQPSFKAGFLFDEIEFLCRRTGYDSNDLWSPALYIYVLRQLLNSIHPALGSLHACSVIRRIRILICIAGATALQDYPLEMALHALRAFITDIQCAEDVIGIVQYLLNHGTPYLKGVPSFLAGMAVSTLTSMRVFLNSSQESTTQESQHKVTMFKAHTFHAWFGTFLDAYTSPDLFDDLEKSFRSLIRAAKNIRGNGNSIQGTYESELLREVFDDQRSQRNLLNRPSQDLIIGFLCSSFETPNDFRDDIFGDDELAVAYVSSVWNTCQHQKYGQGYLLWAGRVLGRAYAANGKIIGEILREAPVKLFETSWSEAYSADLSNSHLCIMRLLCDALLVDDHSEVGVAEKTLQSIVTSSHATELFAQDEQIVPASLQKALLWSPYSCPVDQWVAPQGIPLQDCMGFDRSISISDWLQQSCIALAQTAEGEPLLSRLPQILATNPELAGEAFPYVLHLILLREADGAQASKQILSKAFHEWFTRVDEKTAPHVRMLLNSILYLRTQPLPHENTQAERARWLEIDYLKAAEAASQCGLFKTALLLIEINISEIARASRRSSTVKFEEPVELLLRLYQNIDEYDSFYGVRQRPSLASMMERLDFENAGFKSLSFRGAHYDSQIRSIRKADRQDEQSLLRALGTLDLNGLSHSVLSNPLIGDFGVESTSAMLRTARKLEQWDIAAPSLQRSAASTIFLAFQGLNNLSPLSTMRSIINAGFHNTAEKLLLGEISRSLVHDDLGALAVLSEVEDVLSSTNMEQLEEAWDLFEARGPWMYSENFERVHTIMSSRETLFGSLSKNKHLQRIIKVSLPEARMVETRSLVASARMSRHHGALQASLTTATYLAQLVGSCKDVGLDIHAISQYEGASVLWDQGEITASIRMLQEIDGAADLRGQAVSIGKPELLAKLGHQISEARLEKPDEIIEHYLVPAIKELKGVVDGDEAGQVFHEFASFCDQQLQNADNLEDFQRMEKLRERKEEEVRDFDDMIKASGPQAKEKDILKTHRAKAKQWFDLDDREYRRLRDSRQAFLRQSLENYLLCLRACDKYDNDALRFSALWLEYSSSEVANNAVARHISQVSSRKFALLMNQWTSRLLDTKEMFQKLLSSLVLRICVDHPYHGMYQVFAGSKTKGGKDEMTLRRNAAAVNVINHIRTNKLAAPRWIALHNTNINYVKFATERLEADKIKPGSKVPLRQTAAGQKLDHDISKVEIPPPTMRIELRGSCDYNDIPHVVKFQDEYTVASGISMPKILTAIASDGLPYKQLFKGGNDDLRQDAIMEQVFEQVSNLLKSHRKTRQRNLGIRTYKVLPLTSTSGIIEFVRDTIPLHDYLMPAHQKHFPKDFKPNVCRKYIADAQPKSIETRVKVFRQVTDHFHPVMKYFFMERFPNPDDWFARRLAYTRSTAAISILGYVLGLGDRHGHNILLDEKTGEVVHIDLGIAFEQGRVLPVPEVVPFRLTRDLVDGMGITKTEGVFRRCCEFTLEALRNESYSIMTILDVLRYDPLYNWSVSPLRLKKLQDAQTNMPAPKEEDGHEGVGGKEKKIGNEPGEADRALMVVAKKLSKSLSVTATVNELIQQATDEKNLAVLFAGWAAYA